jgi:hypothetical protein
VADDDDVEIPSDAWDYGEVLMVYCKIPDCEWMVETTWSEVDTGGLEAQYRPHWLEVHANPTGPTFTIAAGDLVDPDQ